MNGTPAKKPKAPPHPHEVFGTRYSQFLEIEELKLMESVTNKLIELNKKKARRYRNYLIASFIINILYAIIYFLKFL